MTHSAAEQSNSAERSVEGGDEASQSALLELRRATIWEFVAGALDEIDFDLQFHDLVKVEKGEDPSCCPNCDRVKAVLRSAIEMNNQLNADLS
jgi:hypothetical protein